MRWAVLILGCVGLAAGTPSLHAQTTLGLSPGDRLRVATDRDPDWRVGVFEGMRDSVLQLGSKGALVRIPLGELTRLEASSGRHASVLGGVAGAILGGAGGAAAGCLANRDDYGVFCGGQSDTKVVVGAALGAAVGGVVGALIFRTETWRPLPVPAR